MDIPQDIIDNVIAAVASGDDFDDKQLLKKCALVSSSFLLPSRKRLFSKISLRGESCCEEIYQFFIRNPVIQSSVRTVILNVKNDGSHFAQTHETTESCRNRISKWMNGTSLLAILRLPFCYLEHFSIIMDKSYLSWDWNSFNSEMKDALSNFLHSPTLKTLCLDGIHKVPTAFFHHIVHLKTLQLECLLPNHFGGEDSSSPTRPRGDSNILIDRCIWRFKLRWFDDSDELYEIPFTS